MSMISPEVEAEEDGQEAVQGSPSVDSIFVAGNQVPSPGSQPGGSFNVWRSFMMFLLEFHQMSHIS